MGANPGDQLYPYLRHPVVDVEVDAENQYVYLIFADYDTESEPLSVARLLALIEERQARSG